MVSGDREMNSVAMTLINPQKEMDTAGIESAASCSQIIYDTN